MIEVLTKINAHPMCYQSIYIILIFLQCPLLLECEPKHISEFSLSFRFAFQTGHVLDTFPFSCLFFFLLFGECRHRQKKKLWARRKNLEHPVFDRNTGRRLHPFDFRPLAFERHGYIAKETASLIRKLASKKAAALELEPSEEIRRW